jgi:hypothetical protein
MVPSTDGVFHVAAIQLVCFLQSDPCPLPPGTSKHKAVRYLDIYEGQFDEAQFADWVKQASQLPGERM